MTILVTGGAGYIGSHTVVELAARGFVPVIVDDFSNAKPAVLGQLEALTGRPVACHKLDIANTKALTAVFRTVKPDAVIHFAGVKAVGESVAEPLKYYRTNVAHAVGLLEVMQSVGVKRLVFSSTATVYGVPKANPIPETAELHPLSPYPQTKLMIEQMLRDVAVSDPDWAVSLLRYFNPVGAHPSGQIGEDSGDAPNNLMPYIAKVAVGKQDHVTVFGNNYDTPDGTGRRDYLHVVDLAEAHVTAVEQLLAGPGVQTYNLGAGRSYSVLEMIAAFERACGHAIPHQFGPRRPGDIADFYADPSLARRELGWTARRTLDDMCADTWRWQQQHPGGYMSI